MLFLTLKRARRWVAIAFVTAITLIAQQTPPSQNFSERLSFGKSMYVKNEHGGHIAFDVISTDLENWGRFAILNSPEKADFIVTITSYEPGTVGFGADAPAQAGVRKALSSSSSVTLRIAEAKTNYELWAGTEKIKSAFKKKNEQDNVIDAAEKLFLRFHDAVDPPGKP